MKKYLLLLSTLAILIAPVSANAGEYGLGVTIASNSLDTAGKEDVDSNGTIDATKNVSDDIFTGSVFAEYTAIEGNYGITFGVDYIPFDADVDRRSISQSSLKDKDSGAASSGTNSVSASIEDHLTFYVQPGVMMTDNSMLYLTYGYVSADINGKSTSLSHTDIDQSKSLDGTKIGVGMKYSDSNSGLFFKIDASETEYDTVSFTTDNNTKATADLDNTAIAISIGKIY
tara:strand:- start:75 stop:761 length:687 start_codon:yes stop_codon:yes gene_type:complete